VVCSSAAARGVWVAREFEVFLQSADEIRNLPVFVRGAATDPIAAQLPAPLAAQTIDDAAGRQQGQDGDMNAHRPFPRKNCVTTASDKQKWAFPSPQIVIIR